MRFNRLFGPNVWVMPDETGWGDVPEWTPEYLAKVQAAARDVSPEDIRELMQVDLNPADLQAARERLTTRLQTVIAEHRAEHSASS